MTSDDNVLPQWASEALAFLPEAIADLAPDDPIHGVGEDVLSLLQTQPTSVRTLAHKKFYAYPFSEVPLYWRRTYEDASLWEIVHILRGHCRPELRHPEDSRDGIGKVVRLCDQAIIFTGAPGRREVIDRILNAVDDQVRPGKRADIGTSGEDDEASKETAGHPSKRRRTEDTPDSLKADAAPHEDTLNKFSIGNEIAQPRIDPRHSIPRLDHPSVERFSTHMHKEHTPVILTNTLRHWPAMTRWKSASYWLARTHDGRRLVPVELGSSYTDQGWGQKIMEFREYLWQYVIGTSMDDRKGYLAQYDLLGQIPALRNDIAVPDYCYIDAPKSKADGQHAGVSEVQGGAALSVPTGDEDDGGGPAADPMLNIWLGPAGTVSPAHTDPHENILAQVVGRKYVRLFPPSETRKLYPMGIEQHEHGGDSEGESEDEHVGAGRSGFAVDMQNTSRVDVGAFVEFDVDSDGEEEGEGEGEAEQQRREFPLHTQAEFVEAVLEAGECLYIPHGWWHYIRSLDVSCSMSFWWD